MCGSTRIDAFMDESWKRIVGFEPDGFYSPFWCQLAWVTPSPPPPPSSQSQHAQRSPFMGAHIIILGGCACVVGLGIVNGGSCADSLDDGKIAGTSFWLASVNINGSFPGHG